jgi:hypothetical protein
MIKWLGYEFKNYEELKEFNKQGAIETYKQYVRLLDNATTSADMMARSSAVSEQSLYLHDKLGMTWDEIDALTA